MERSPTRAITVPVNFDLIYLLALVIRRTVPHDLSFLAIRRTMQINSRATKNIKYFWKQKLAICVGNELDYYESNYVRQSKLEGLRLGLGLGCGFVRLLSCVGYNPSGYTQDCPAYNISLIYLARAT